MYGIDVVALDKAASNFIRCMTSRDWDDLTEDGVYKDDAITIIDAFVCWVSSGGYVEMNDGTTREVIR